MVWKNLLVVFRYPINLLARFLTLFSIILVMMFATLMFVPGSVAEGFEGEGGSGIGGLVMYGFVLFLFVSDALWTVGYNIRWEQYEGTLEALYLTPASRFLYLVSRLAEPVIWTTLSAAASLLFVRLILGPLPMENKGLALYTLLFTLAGIFGFGFCFAAFTLLVKESAQSVANLLQFVLLTICAMFFPFSALPQPVRTVSRFVPLSYGVDLFRSALMGFPPGFPELASVRVEVAIVTVSGLLLPAAGYALYKWAEHQVRVNGTLAEF